MHRLSILQLGLSAFRVSENVIDSEVAPRHKLFAFSADYFVISTPDDPSLFRSKTALFIFAFIQRPKQVFQQYPSTLPIVFLDAKPMFAQDPLTK